MYAHHAKHRSPKKLEPLRLLEGFGVGTCPPPEATLKGQESAIGGDDRHIEVPEICKENKTNSVFCSYCLQSQSLVLPTESYRLPILLVLPTESETCIAYRDLLRPQSACIAYRVRVLYHLQRPIASPICSYCLQSQSLVLPTENYLQPLRSYCLQT